MLSYQVLKTGKVKHLVQWQTRFDGVQSRPHIDKYEWHTVIYEDEGDWETTIELQARNPGFGKLPSENVLTAPEELRLRKTKEAFVKVAFAAKAAPHPAAMNIFHAQEAIVYNDGLYTPVMIPEVGPGLEDADLRCSICHLEFGADCLDPVTLPCQCKSTYGRECIKTWMSDHDRCPYCNVEVKMVPEQAGAITGPLFSADQDTLEDNLIGWPGRPVSRRERLRDRFVTQALQRLSDGLDHDFENTDIEAVIHSFAEMLRFTLFEGSVYESLLQRFPDGARALHVFHADSNQDVMLGE